MTSHVIVTISATLLVLQAVIHRTKTSTSSQQCNIVAVFGLRTADCTAQGYNVIPHTIQSSDEISVLMLDNNRLHSLPAYSFRPYVNLQEVHLGRNSVELVERWAFRGLRSLQRIDLSFNRLTTISQYFLDEDIRASLRFLSLNDNPIRTIDANAFSNLTHLEELNLEGCWLKEFELNLLIDLKRLTNLNLENNQLRGFRSDLCPYQFCLPQRLSVLRLSRNRWRCDCRLRWFRMWLNNSKVNWDFGRSSPACSEPELLKDISWRYVSPDQFACASEIHINATTVYLPHGSTDACSLRCDVTGYPEPTVTWYRHAQRVHDTSRQVSYSDDVSHVTSCVRLINVTRTQAGDYRCVANNSAGRSEFYFKLNVIDALQTPSSSDDLTIDPQGQTNKPRVTRLELILGATGGALFLAFMFAVFIICLSRRIDRDKRAYKVRDHERRSSDVEGEKEVSGARFIDRNTHTDESEGISRTAGDLINDQNIKQLTSLLFLSNGHDKRPRSYADDKTISNWQNCVRRTDNGYHLNPTRSSQQGRGGGGEGLQLGSLSSPKRAVMIQFDMESLSLVDKLSKERNKNSYEEQILSNITFDRRQSSGSNSREISSVCPTTSITPDLLNNSVLDVWTKKSESDSARFYNGFQNNADKLSNDNSPQVSKRIASSWRCTQGERIHRTGPSGVSCFALPSSPSPPVVDSIHGPHNVSASESSDRLVNETGINIRESRINSSPQDNKHRAAAANNKQSGVNILNSNPHAFSDHQHDSAEISQVTPLLATQSITSADSLFSVNYSLSNALSPADHSDRAVALSPSLPSSAPFCDNTLSVNETSPFPSRSSPAVIAANAFAADFGCYNTRNMLSTQTCFNGSAFMEERSRGERNETKATLLRTRSLAPSVPENSAKCENKTHSDCSKHCLTLTTDYRRGVTSQIESIKSREDSMTSLNTIPRDVRTINKKEPGLRHGSSGLRVTLPESIAGVTEGLYPRPPPKPARMLRLYERLVSVQETDTNVGVPSKVRRHTNPQSWITNC